MIRKHYVDQMTVNRLIKLLHFPKNVSKLCPRWLACNGHYSMINKATIFFVVLHKLKTRPLDMCVICDDYASTGSIYKFKKVT